MCRKLNKSLLTHSLAVATLLFPAGLLLPNASRAASCNQSIGGFAACIGPFDCVSAIINTAGTQCGFTYTTSTKKCTIDYLDCFIEKRRRLVASDIPNARGCEDLLGLIPRCESTAPPVPECPDPEFTAVEPPPPQFVAGTTMDPRAIGGYVDLSPDDLGNPRRKARFFFGIDELDRLTVFNAELWGVDDLSFDKFQNRFYELLPATTVMERVDHDLAYSLPGGSLLEFEVTEAWRANWRVDGITTLVLVSGQSSAEAAGLLGLTPVTLFDADRRRDAVRLDARGKEDPGIKSFR